MSDRHGLLRALREPRSANELLWARVTVLAMVTVILVLAGAFVFYRLERNAPGSEVTTYGDALFWTSSQITTISSSLANPISTGGRILAVLTDLASIAVVSLLFGTIVQHIHIASPKRERSFQRTAEEDDAAEPSTVVGAPERQRGNEPPLSV
jgi:hypothetical protein